MYNITAYIWQAIQESADYEVLEGLKVVVLSHSIYIRQQPELEEVANILITVTGWHVRISYKFKN
jgi:hypothetical protein